MISLLSLLLSLCTVITTVDACARTASGGSPATTPAPAATTAASPSNACATCTPMDITVLPVPVDLQGTAAVPSLTLGTDPQTGCATLTITCTGPADDNMFMEFNDGMFFSINSPTMGTLTEKLYCLTTDHWQQDPTNNPNQVQPDINNVACQFI